MGTFSENFGVETPKKTYLCYEVEQPEGDSRIPEDQLKGFLRNQVTDPRGQGLVPRDIQGEGLREHQVSSQHRPLAPQLRWLCLETGRTNAAVTGSFGP